MTMLSLLQPNCLFVPMFNSSVPTSHCVIVFFKVTFTVYIYCKKSFKETLVSLNLAQYILCWAQVANRYNTCCTAKNFYSKWVFLLSLTDYSYTKDTCRNRASAQEEEGFVKPETAV